MNSNRISIARALAICVVAALVLSGTAMGSEIVLSNSGGGDWGAKTKITLTEKAGIERVNEIVEVNLQVSKISSCTKEIRVIDSNNNEIESQVLEEGSSSCKVVFAANAKANTAAIYYIYYNNPKAITPNYKFKYILLSDSASTDNLNTYWNIYQAGPASDSWTWNPGGYYKAVTNDAPGNGVYLIPKDSYRDDSVQSQTIEADMYSNYNPCSSTTKAANLHMGFWDSVPPLKGNPLRGQLVIYGVENGIFRVHYPDGKYDQSSYTCGEWVHNKISIDISKGQTNIITWKNNNFYKHEIINSKQTGPLVPYVGEYASNPADVRVRNIVIKSGMEYPNPLSVSLGPEESIQRQPQITLIKSLSPSTISEGDSTTVTIRVENTGGDAKSVKITDAIPQGFTFVSGSASQEYSALKATESRTFQYTIKATGTGRFVSDLATVTYQDDKGNSYSGASNSATITVQAGQAGQAQPKTPGFGSILAGIGIILALALRRR